MHASHGLNHMQLEQFVTTCAGRKPSDLLPKDL
jgi:hypothetical protein